MPEWSVETNGLAEFLDALVEVLRTQGWECTANATVEIPPVLTISIRIAVTTWDRTTMPL